MITRIIRTAALAALTLGIVTACGAQAADAPQPEPWSQYATSSPAATPAAPAPANPGRPAAAGEPGGPATNERGNLEKEIKQAGALLSPSTGQPAFEFAVQAITFPKGCPNKYSTVPDGMRPVAVDMTINTKDDPDRVLTTTPLGYGWEYLAPDGTSINTTEQMPCEYNTPDMKPNRKYTTTVWLWIPKDAPTDGTASLAWTPAGVGNGYEWKLKG